MAALLPTLCRIAMRIVGSTFPERKWSLPSKGCRLDRNGRTAMLTASLMIRCTTRTTGLTVEAGSLIDGWTRAVLVDTNVLILLDDFDSPGMSVLVGTEFRLWVSGYRDRESFGLRPDCQARSPVG
ncbi:MULTISPECIES: hypothetical protein [unclassified Nocardia]|uniref:hypothetical protein n=1 Tax=unclassified Nocardia TaxID=2637762 RepID=UPI001CE43E65|nr:MULTISPECIES: hypothetical protein [unclassified Nocardia]